MRINLVTLITEKDLHRNYVLHPRKIRPFNVIQKWRDNKMRKLQRVLVRNKRKHRKMRERRNPGFRRRAPKKRAKFRPVSL